MAGSTPTQPVIKGMTQSLKWLVDMLALFDAQPIKIPADYRTQVIQTKKLLNDDTSGLVNTVLDFAISSALVNYRIETPNENLTKVLNDWLDNINVGVRGKAPTGIEALAKEYFRERWKGSSNLLLRTFWEDTGTRNSKLLLPTTLFFVDGEDIVLKNKRNQPIRLGDEQYALRVSNNSRDDIMLPASEDEMIFIQKPFETWGTRHPVPFFIKRGLFRNLMFLKLLEQKGEFVVGRALEYLMLIKKGTEKMAMEGRAELTYDENDLKGISDDLKNLLMKMKNEGGTPHYTTNFDTEIEHLIPDYSKVLAGANFSATEKRLLAGLGLVDVVEGSASTRRESILNPKPFISEVRQGIKDFKSMLNDIVQTIVERNTNTRRKWMGEKITIHNGIVTEFVNDKFRQMLRGIYDRGSLSKRTLVEVVGELDYEFERQQRKKEKSDGDEKLMFAPVIQNIEGAQEGGDPTKKDNTDNVPGDKKGVEKKNFQGSALTCPECGEEADIDLDGVAHDDRLECPHCDETFDASRIIGKPKDPRRKASKHKKKPKRSGPLKYSTVEVAKIELPSEVKVLPEGAKSIWKKTYDSVLENTNDTEQANKTAWTNVKLKYKAENGKWVRKSQAEVAQALSDYQFEDLLSLKKAEVLGKQNKLLDKLIKSAEEDKDEDI